MAVQVTEVFATARALLNDVAAQTFSDVVLMPFIRRAHQELQVKLKFSNSPIMKAHFVQSVASSLDPITTIVSPANMLEPIEIYEKGAVEPDIAYVPMTQREPLPVLDPTTRSQLVFWEWGGNVDVTNNTEQIYVSACNVTRIARVRYWRKITLPTAITDSIFFANGELYLAPRVAALAAGSLGNAENYTIGTTVANESLNEVIKSNKGSVPPTANTARMRP